MAENGFGSLQCDSLFLHSLFLSLSISEANDQRGDSMRQNFLPVAGRVTMATRRRSLTQCILLDMTYSFSFLSLSLSLSFSLRQGENTALSGSLLC